MKGLVVQFRRGKHIINERHFLLDFGLKTRDEARKAAGKDVVWVSPGKNKKEIKGKIADAHGGKGLVRAIFEKGLPGQSINTEVEMIGEIVKEKAVKEKKVKETKTKEKSE